MNILNISVFDSKYCIGFEISTPASPIRNTSASEVKINKEQEFTEVDWWESQNSKFYFISIFVRYVFFQVSWG